VKVKGPKPPGFARPSQSTPTLDSLIRELGGPIIAVHSWCCPSWLTARLAAFEEVSHASRTHGGILSLSSLRFAMIRNVEFVNGAMKKSKTFVSSFDEEVEICT
jgi:hypothetical protein